MKKLTLREFIAQELNVSVDNVSMAGKEITSIRLGKYEVTTSHYTDKALSDAYKAYLKRDRWVTITEVVKELLRKYDITPHLNYIDARKKGFRIKMQTSLITDKERIEIVARLRKHFNQFDVEINFDHTDCWNLTIYTNFRPVSLLFPHI